MTDTPRCFPDNHDIISMKLYQLMVEHSPEEESQDWSKIEPSVSLLKSPKGRWRKKIRPLQVRRLHLPHLGGAFLSLDFRIVASWMRMFDSRHK